jgi:hypothetical protein
MKITKGIGGGGEATNVNAFHHMNQGLSPRSRVEGTHSNAFPFIRSKDINS